MKRRCGGCDGRGGAWGRMGGGALPLDAAGDADIRCGHVDVALLLKRRQGEPVATACEGGAGEMKQCLAIAKK